ncbi:MAG TPA: sulfate adenylyltransferase, partial [Dehalococcoidia bacterium]|nr:sulfate adenylyltransferase [Dehalococcoidia bacterium]
MTGKNGGQPLKELLVTGSEAEALRDTARGLPVLRLGARSLSDLELLAIGGYSPLDGFMTRADYLGAVNDMHLTSGEAWGMPITLAVSEEEAASLKDGDEVALADETGRAMAVLEIREKFTYDKALEARNVFRTEEEAHPGVAALYAQGPVLLGGPVRAFEVPPHADFGAYRLTPAQTRAEFERRGWKTVVGFQTRNPVHRAHEYIQKCALEIVDGLLLHPLVGE